MQLPGGCQVIDIRVTSGIKEGPVADDEPGSRPLDILNIVIPGRVYVLNGTLPEVPQQDLCEFNGGSALIIQHYFLHLIDGALTEQRNRSNRSIRCDRMMTNDASPGQPLDRRNRDQSDINLMGTELIDQAGRIVVGKFHDPGHFRQCDPMNQGLGIPITDRSDPYLTQLN